VTIPAENNDVLRPDTQVTITGRNVEVPDHFAERVHAKLAKIARLDPTLTFFHVELQHEPNPRRADESDKIQITATGKGHIARAEAKEDSFYAALETALARMDRSLRKVKARRRISRSGHRAPKGAAVSAQNPTRRRTRSQYVFNKIMRVKPLARQCEKHIARADVAAVGYDARHGFVFRRRRKVEGLADEI